ncbi:MAG TPA: hypothetical protein VJ774_01060 [Actinomycetota bacterium]|nr:hypothetical protein [Actinomycetota bacterium]
MAPKRVLKVRSKEIRFRGKQPSPYTLGNKLTGPWAERRDEPPHGGRPDAFGDECVQKAGHHGSRYPFLDTTERASGRVVADHDQHGAGCEISNVLERDAEVGFDNDRVWLAVRHGVDQRVLGLGDRDDFKPACPESSLHAADVASRDHAEPVAERLRRGGQSLGRGGTFNDRHDARGSR